MRQHKFGFLFLILIAMSVICLPAQDSHFGKMEAGESALIGVLYDFKQKQDHQPTGVSGNAYWTIVDEFLSTGWNEDVLNRYFRSSRPLYTTQIYIPRLDADKGTIAFGVDKIVKPNEYVIYYQGQVTPPSDGTYRFVGLADNFIAVSVNGKTEMLSEWVGPPLPKLNWQAPAAQHKPAYQHAQPLQNGTWFTVKAGDVVDLNILMGESDGGASSYFLLIEKQDSVYPKNDQGDPILPIFQVAAYDTPHIPADMLNYNGPAFSPSTPWKCLQ